LFVLNVLIVIGWLQIPKPQGTTASMMCKGTMWNILIFQSSTTSQLEDMFVWCQCCLRYVCFQSCMWDSWMCLFMCLCVNFYMCWCFRKEFVCHQLWFKVNATCMGCKIICKHWGLFSKYDKQKKKYNFKPN
jgi:hypothetical protein